jgi:hypothetical protein
MKSLRNAWVAMFALCTLPFAPRLARAVCAVDCNGDRVVDIAELIGGADILLGRHPLGACQALDRNIDGHARVDELVQGVRNAIEGCPAEHLIVFGAEANRLHAYDGTVAGAPFPEQTVIPSSDDDPTNGRDINAQICFRRADNGALYFIAGEDTNQPNPPQGWGYFRLDGDSVGSLSATQVGKLTPTYQPTPDNAENYGCGFLNDGRLFTTDVGNQAGGDPNGQLIIWFPPFDQPDPKYCKIDIAIATAQQIAIDGQDRVYVSSSRGATIADPGGVFRYSGVWPTSGDASGGCGRVDGTGGPLVDAGRITKEVIISDPENIATPAGVVLKPGGGFYVASVLTGIIAEYDAAGVFVRRVLEPDPEEDLPFPSSGNPLGIGLASDGTIYYADIGLRIDLGPPIQIGPGPNLGKVRRLRFVDGQPQAPEILDDTLNFPDGIGILEQ